MAGQERAAALAGGIARDMSGERTQQSKKCARCGAVFLRHRSYSTAQWDRAKFCSRSCAATTRVATDNEIISAYRLGKSSSEIGSCYGISSAHVLRIIRANGVKTRDHSENKKISHSRPETKARLSLAASGRRLTEAAKEKLRLLSGPKNARWRGGISLTVGGYLQFTESPANGVHAGRLIHRIIAEYKTGAKIQDGHHVHHIDGNKLNNDPGNLAIISASEHAKLHTPDRERNKKQNILRAVK